MKRDDRGLDDDETRSDKRRDSQDNQHESNGTNTTTTTVDKRPKLDTSLDLKDLGAGYEAEERKVVRAINIYQTKLLPYIEQNPSIFKKSNFLALKGYAVGVSSADYTSTTSDH